MKIINFLVLMSVMSCLSPVVFALNNATTQFDTLYNTALAEAWKTPLEDARKKIQSIKNTPDGTKPTEMIYDNGNYFCQGVFGTCDDNSFFWKLVKGCEIARDETIKEMIQRGHPIVNSNTGYLSDSYTSCPDLAGKVTQVNEDAASIEIAGWQGDQITKSRTQFAEKTQTSFQEKVSNVWDVFKKKMVNFVRSIEGITRNAYR